MTNNTDRKLTDKQQAFVVAIEDYSNKDTFGNGTASARAAGYHGTSNTLNQRAHELVINSKVIKARAEIKAERGKEMDYSLDTQRAKLDSAYVIAKEQKSPTGMTAAVREQNAISGHHIQTIITDPDQQRELSEAETRLGLEIIRLRRELAYGVAETLPEATGAAPEAGQGQRADTGHGQGLRLKTQAGAEKRA